MIFQSFDLSCSICRSNSSSLVRLHVNSGISCPGADDEQRHLPEPARPSGKKMDAGPLPVNIGRKRQNEVVVPERRVYALQRCRLCKGMPGRRQIPFGFWGSRHRQRKMRRLSGVCGRLPFRFTQV